MASKTLAEQAAWKFVADNDLAFDITVLNPYVIMGPMLQPVAGPEQVTSTNLFPVYNFLNGTYKEINGLVFPAWYYVSLILFSLVPRDTNTHQVDVRDVARAHILSLTTAAASNKRILLVSGMITPQTIINIIRKNFPSLHSRVIEGNPAQLVPEGIEPTDWDVSRSFEIFGPDWKYIGLEKTVTDTVNNLLEHEAKWGKV
jgi:nucleoside-diphosphate-sugar epimerase